LNNDNNEREKFREEVDTYKRRRFIHFSPPFFQTFQIDHIFTEINMGNEKSIVTGKTADVEMTKQTSAHSKDLDRRQRVNIKMVQNVLLIWLDTNIDDNNEDCRNTITQLRGVVNDINTFTDGDESIQFINTITDNKICMIISGSLGEHIVPQVHNMSQVDSIFIFCGNKKRHEQWTKEWSKIKGVFAEIASICEALKQASQQCEQNAISISFVATSGDATNENLDRLDPMFMYTQIMKEILLTIDFKQQNFQEFIDYCRDVFNDNKKELKNVDKFRQKYHDETPVWWYTCECFLYPLLNRALRMSDVDIIIKMGFFIGDLHRQIEKLHKEQFGDHQNRKTFPAYRGQGLSKTDFDQLMNTKGGLMSFNNFLSTSKDRNVSLRFARNALTDPNSMGILFVMTIDPSQSTTPFASVNGVSYFKDKEDEVLFSMHTVFRIADINPIGENHRLIQVDLTLTAGNDKDLQILTDHIREETNSNAQGWDRLGWMLHKMGQFQKSQQVYETMLEQVTNESEKGNIYCQLGSAKCTQGEYKEAIILYEKSLEIVKATLPLNHLNLTASYNNIGSVYYNMGDHSKALASYEKTLKIVKRILPPNHPDLAMSYNNIGAVYFNMGDYSTALSYFEKALQIRQQSLPPNHPHLATSYNNIGEVYRNMGDYTKARSSHEKALEIQEKSLPLNHPDLAASYNNIGEVYRNMGDYSNALLSHEKALKIRQQSFPSNHPDLATSYNNIGNVYDNTGDYSKALSFHEKALEFRQQSLPSNHSDLASSYDNIGLVYENMGDYSKAGSFYERAVNIGQQSLPSTHPHLHVYRNNLDRVQKKL
jgi:tetratricopeptide (TPR) repeat protein